MVASREAAKGICNHSWSLDVERKLQLFASQYTDAAHLVAINPALAFCLAHLPTWDTAIGKGDPDVLIHRLLREKRRFVCGFLGFPESDAVFRLLSKIPMQLCYLPILMRLRVILREQPATLRMLCHLPVFDKDTLFFAANWRWGDCVTAALFRELATELQDNQWAYSGMLEDCVSMEQQLAKKRSQPFRKIKEIRWYHDQLVAELNDTNIETAKDGDHTSLFPPPPIGGTATIIPLHTPALLSEEGRIQHHCAAIYAKSIFAGKIYLYRVLKPRRATLAIEKVDDKWLLRELRASCNADPGKETRLAVESWLTGIAA